MKRCLALVLGLTTFLLPRLQAAVPEVINFQGRVTVNDTPFTGLGKFRFALVDGAGTTSYWSHDGTSASGAPPATDVNVTVQNGVYAVPLGDVSLPNMTQPVSNTVFATHTDVYLRVWFDDGTHGSLLLSPDTRIVSVGYALVAATVTAGAITGTELAPALTLGSATAAGEITLQQLDGQKGLELQGDFQGSGRLAAKNKSGATTVLLRGENDQPGGELTLLDPAGRSLVRLNALGGTNAGARLTLGDHAGRTTVELSAEDTSDTAAVLRLSNRNGVATTELNAGAGDGAALISLWDNLRRLKVSLDAKGDRDGGVLELGNADGLVTARLSGDAGDLGSLLQLRDSSNRRRIELDPQLELGTTTLRLYNEDQNQAAELSLFAGHGILNLGHPDGSIAAELRANGPFGGAALKLHDVDGTLTIEADGAHGTTKGGYVALHDSDGTTTVTLDADDESEGGRIELHRGSGARTVRLSGDLDGDGKGALQLFKSDGVTETVRLTGSYLGTGGGFAHFKDATGKITIQLNGDDNGEGKITTQVLQITGGSDLSERFDIHAPTGARVEPGMLVCIDPDRPGELRLSDHAHDATVAGIISGAGGVKPGMLMGQAGTRADGRHPVALTGRVYCQVDATRAAVRPGDLLTTSDQPGLAMKADPEQARGAIIGKAMTPLAQGHGLVLVLVSLQ